MAEPDPRVAQLVALLAAYQPDPAEQPSFDAMVALARTAAEPYGRNRFEPGHFTASGFVRSPDGHSVLLVEHRRLGRWLQPGGHVDPDDVGPLDAALREIVEETGCARPVPLAGQLFGVDVHPIPRRYDEPSHRHFDLQFAFLVDNHHLEPSDEVAAARWVAWEELEDLGADAATRKGVERLLRSSN